MGKKAYINPASEELGLTPYQLRRMAKEHKIPFLMSGSRYIFDVDLCKEFLKEQALKNAEPQKGPVKQYGVLRRIEG